MERVTKVVREVIGLFVDDGRFALPVLVWIALAWPVQVRLRTTGSGGVVLFAGLGLILIESVVRFSRGVGKRG